VEVVVRLVDWCTGRVERMHVKHGLAGAWRPAAEQVVPRILKQRVFAVRKIQISPKQFSAPAVCSHARFPDMNPPAGYFMDGQLNLSRREHIEQFIEHQSDAVVWRA